MNTHFCKENPCLEKDKECNQILENGTKTMHTNQYTIEKIRNGCWELRKDGKKISEHSTQGGAKKMMKKMQPYHIVWDLETTGFVAPESKILEIGCFIIRGDEIERKHWVLDNNIEIPEKIIEITGITPEIIAAEGRDPAECLNEFLPLFKNCEKNITHNGIRFDIPFLTAFAASVLGWDEKQTEAVTSLLRLTAFDTAVHFKAKKLNMEPMEKEHFVNFADRVMEIRAYGVKYNLGLCVEELGITLDVKQHRAMGDVELTHEVYKKIVLSNVAQESQGTRT